MEDWEIAVIVVLSLLIVGVSVFGIVYWRKYIRANSNFTWSVSSTNNDNLKNNTSIEMSIRRRNDKEPYKMPGIDEESELYEQMAPLRM